MGTMTRAIKQRILDLASRAGYDVEKAPGSFPPYRVMKQLRLGHDPLSDIRTILNAQVNTIFDVGAHVGQTAARFATAFPRARIYSFEPDPTAFNELRSVGNRTERVQPVNAAVSDRDGQATFFVNRFNQTSSLLKAAPDAAQYLVDRTGLTLASQIDVRVVTLDRFCAEHQIERIDLLKVDAQGSELRVLNGARQMIDRVAVPVILLEVCFVRIYEDQPLFPELYQYVFDRGYRLVWLYDTSFHTHFYSLGANAIFIHESLGRREHVAN
jgi:FkbM family methyltransferase